MSADAALWSSLPVLLSGVPALVVDAGFLRAVCGDFRIRGRARLAFPWGSYFALFFTLLANLAFLVFALRRWGALEIRTDAAPPAFIPLIAQGYLFALTLGFPWLGLSVRDDAVEGRNPAALLASLGALSALNLIFTGGNLGEGPSYENNVFSVGLATGAFALIWFALECFARISVSISEEHDRASGIRTCGFFLAQGLILGRAVAGDWHSPAATVHDFLQDGMMSLFVLGLAIPIEHFCRPSARNPAPPTFSFGALPAFLHLFLATAWLIRLGPWEGFR